MPVSVAEFMRAAQDSGLLTAEVLAGYVVEEASDTDAAPLAGRLVKDGRLTSFQAKHIYGGKARGLLLGPYVVLDVLGKGGMGHVYKAEHRKMRRVVALKVIAKAALRSPEAVRRFEREVQAAARLEHPNIVTAFDAGEAGGTHYLVMQLVDGRTLAQIVKEDGPQPAGRAVDWVLQAARGLAYAHGRGVVHRDVKPGNLLLDRDGTVKILDMGLARLESSDADQDQLTGTGQVMGTVDYMAPEQALDTRRADARADVYSLGVTLWYLLAGRPLFAGDTAMNKMMAHMQSPPPTLPRSSSAAGAALDRVFQRMVAKKPEDRFQSMEEVIAALEALPREALMGPDGGPRPAADGAAARQAAVGEATQTTPWPMAASAVSADRDVGGVGPAAREGNEGRDVVPARWRPATVAAVAGGIAGTIAVVVAGTLALGGRKDGRPAVARAQAPSLPPDGAAAVATGAIEAKAATTGPNTPAPTQQATARPPAASRPAAPPAAAVAPFDSAEARRHQEAWARHLGVAVTSTNSLGMTLVVIPPGTFTFGEGRPACEITLTKPFLLGATEVTQAQWREIMGTEPWKVDRHSIAGDDVAAANISWDDARAFCGKLTGRERAAGRIGRDQTYRLPVAAEWEHACRAGTATRYSFGDDAAALGDHGWFGGGWDREQGMPIPGGDTAAEPHPHAVGLKQPGPWGLFDVHGNVWERCDAWSADHPQGLVADGAKSPGQALRDSHDARGGSWSTTADDCRSAVRYAFTAGRAGDVGLRVVLDAAGASGPVAGE